MSDDIQIRVIPATVPTTAAAFHPKATRVDALGMPVAFVDLSFGEGTPDPWPYHPTPCCGAAASCDEYGTVYCKACYEEVDPAFGNYPVEPYREFTDAR